MHYKKGVLKHFAIFIGKHLNDCFSHKTIILITHLRSGKYLFLFYILLYPFKFKNLPDLQQILELKKIFRRKSAVLKIKKTKIFKREVKR